MFKLFRKKVDTQAVIAEIHNEFDTAGEKLLREAKIILSKGVDVEKGERLKKIGFVGSKVVSEVEQILKERSDSKELAELIEYYRQWYPSNKFITEKVVEEICKKYNLLCGTVGRYIGDVPDKNIKEIEQFKLRDEDMAIHYPFREYRISMRQINALANYWPRRPQYGPPIPEPEITPEQWAQEERRKEDFKICAPETDFNTNGMTKSGYKLIPDPIVLQPVKGGYLIVSKWGLEASDESLINENHN